MAGRPPAKGQLVPFQRPANIYEDSRMRPEKATAIKQPSQGPMIDSKPLKSSKHTQSKTKPRKKKSKPVTEPRRNKAGHLVNEHGISLEKIELAKQGKLIDKTGIQMKPQSLANLQPRMWKPGESGNPAGQPKEPKEVFRDTLLEVLQSKDSEDNKKTRMQVLFEELLERSKNAPDDRTYQSYVELIHRVFGVNLVNGSQKSTKGLPENIGVLVLPPAGEKKQELNSDSITDVTFEETE